MPEKTATLLEIRFSTSAFGDVVAVTMARAPTNKRHPRRPARRFFKLSGLFTDWFISKRCFLFLDVPGKAPRHRIFVVLSTGFRQFQVQRFNSFQSRRCT